MGKASKKASKAIKAIQEETIQEETLQEETPKKEKKGKKAQKHSSSQGEEPITIFNRSSKAHRDSLISEAPFQGIAVKQQITSTRSYPASFQEQSPAFQVAYSKFIRGEEERVEKDPTYISKYYHR